MLNYYEILEIQNIASQEEIAWAYSRLALKYHPKKNEQRDLVYNNAKFAQIAEAFEVLSSNALKGVYDFYGYDGLKYGITDENGNLKGGYKFNGDMYTVFEKYFGTRNPHMLLKDTEPSSDDFGSMFDSGYGGMYNVLHDPPKDVIVELEVTLEEIYCGALKTIFYKKSILQNSGRNTTEKDCSRVIEVIKGVSNGEKYEFIGDGNQKPGYCNLKELKHELFIRDGVNLFYKYSLSLAEALLSKSIQIITLDNRVLNVFLDEIVTPSSVKEVKGEGFVISNNYSEIKDVGQLYILFSIIFPKFLNPENKELITNLLRESTSDDKDKQT